MKERVEMLFKCDQKWDEMKPHGLNRYCGQCNKVIHDFSGQSIREIKAYSTDELCGRFSIEQIEPDLIPLKITATVRNIIFAAGTFLGTNVNPGFSQSPPKEEFVQLPHNYKNTFSKTEYSADTLQKKPLKERKSVCSGKSVRQKPKWFLSKRFPFIKRKRVVRLTGRFRI